MANPIIAGDALARGLKNTFDNTWQRRYTGLVDRLGLIMDMGIQSDKITELYGFFESAPYPEFRKYGNEVASKAFRARNYEVENFSWDISVEWKQEDRIFDQLKGLERMARQAGENFATLPERIAVQLLTDASDPALLPFLPNAPDGAPLFSTVDGASAPRFGITGGNIETGSGVASADAVRTDLFNSAERMARFQDPEGQPAMDASVIDQGLTIMFNVANSKIFREAFVQAFTLQAGGSSDAAVTNVILDSGMKVTLWPTQRITDNDWFVFSDAFEPKPLLQQIAKPLTESIMTEETSDLSRKTKSEGLFWNTLQGYGVNTPLGAVKVNN